MNTNQMGAEKLLEMISKKMNVPKEKLAKAVGSGDIKEISKLLSPEKAKEFEKFATNENNRKAASGSKQNGTKRRN